MKNVMIRKDSIINICMNYDVIVNYVYSEEDLMTKILIDYYRDYIDVINLNSTYEVDMIYKYDQALAYYLEHYKFKKMVKDEYNTSNNYGNEIMSNLIGLYNNYLNLFSNEENQPKWL